MKLILQREPSQNDATHGSITRDGIPQCVSLEDKIREIEGVPVEEWKIKGKTAIPAGIYDLRITWSNRFQKMMPQLMNVPGFEGIRIHPGNYAGLETFFKNIPRSIHKDVLYSDEYVEIFDDKKNK